MKEFLRRQESEVPRRKRNCPDEYRLAAFVEETLDQDSRKRVEQHLESCSYCLGQIVFLLKTQDLSGPSAPASLIARARELERPSSRNPIFAFGIPALAAAFVLVLAFLLWIPFQSSTPLQPPLQTERGADNEVFEVFSPTQNATVSDFPFVLRWEPVARAFSYEIRIASLGGDLVWQHQADGTEALLPATADLQNGSEYYLYVRARLPEGRVIRSEMVRFQVGSAAK